MIAKLCVQKESSRIEELNKITQGDISEIKNIIQNKEQENYFELFSEWMRLAYKMNITKLIPWIDKLSQSNKQNQELFCVYSISIIRECIMSNFYRTVVTPKASFLSFLLLFLYYSLHGYFFFSMDTYGPQAWEQFTINLTLFVHFFLQSLTETFFS